MSEGDGLTMHTVVSSNGRNNAYEIRRYPDGTIGSDYLKIDITEGFDIDKEMGICRHRINTAENDWHFYNAIKHFLRREKDRKVAERDRKIRELADVLYKTAHPNPSAGGGGGANGGYWMMLAAAALKNIEESE